MTRDRTEPQEPPERGPLETFRKVRLTHWAVPNFAANADPGGDGVPIADLRQEALDELALAWITDLYRKAGRKPPDLKWHVRSSHP